MFYLPFLAEIDARATEVGQGIWKQIFLVYFFYTENPKDLPDGKTFFDSKIYATSIMSFELKFINECLKLW